MIIAVDTGGTKTLIARFADGVIEDSAKFPTPHSFDDYITTVASHIQTLSEGATPEVISMAAPGIIRHDVVEVFANLPWKNAAIPEKLSSHFPDSLIIIENDANLGGLGEVRLLDRIPHKALYATISTGVGLGLIIDGHIDPNLSDLEGGHIKLMFDGKLQEWEDFGSGRAIQEAFGKYARDIHDEATWSQIIDRIAPGFDVHIPILQPDIIILGGSVGSYYPRYEKLLNRAVLEKLHPIITTHPTFMQAKYPEEAVAYGCYFHAVDRLSSLST